MIRTILLIGSGGFLGSVLRHYIALWIGKTPLFAFPLGTLLVNVLGSFLIGLIYGLSDRTDMVSPETRYFLATGFCGGFTTFSTFSYESFGLFQAGSQGVAIAYIVSSLLLGLLGVFLGIGLSRAIS